MRVLFFGTYDAGRHPKFRTIQEGVASAGNDVVACNAPLGLDTAARVEMLQHPWRVPLLDAQLVARWWRLWRSARRLPSPDAVIVGYLGHFDVQLARGLCPGGRSRWTTWSRPPTRPSTGACLPAESCRRSAGWTAPGCAAATCRSWIRRNTRRLPGPAGAGGRCPCRRPGCLVPGTTAEAAAESPVE